MNARDEETSFRIFSTLNSRGIDLTMVDKLKADLLQVGGALLQGAGARLLGAAACSPRAQTLVWAVSRGRDCRMDVEMLVCARFTPGLPGLLLSVLVCG